MLSNFVAYSTHKLAWTSICCFRMTSTRYLIKTVCGKKKMSHWWQYRCARQLLYLTRMRCTYICVQSSKYKRIIIKIMFTWPNVLWFCVGEFAFHVLLWTFVIHFYFKIVILFQNSSFQSAACNCCDWVVNSNRWIPNIQKLKPVSKSLNCHS